MTIEEKAKVYTIDEYIEKKKKYLGKRYYHEHPHVVESYDVYGMEEYEIKEMINKLKKGELEL